MNRLQFSEGGQPVYLDDLELLQNELNNIFVGILELISESGSLYGDAKFLTTDVAPIVSGDEVLYNGGGILFRENNSFRFCKFYSERFKSEDVKAVYVCIDRTDAEERLFRDGTRHPCHSHYTAKLSLTPSGNLYNYELSQLSTLRLSPKVLPI